MMKRFVLLVPHFCLSDSNKEKTVTKQNDLSKSQQNYNINK